MCLFQQRDFSGILAKMKACSDNLTSFPKTLIFCKQKKTVCDVYFHLRHMLKSASLLAVYHASLSAETKEHVSSLFSSTDSQLRCLVSTIAFGMVSIDTHTILVSGMFNTHF